MIVAILVSYTALRLTERVAGAERRAGRLWLIGGAVSMGIGIWSMHFIGMLAFSVPPVTLRYNLLINLASLFIGMLTSLFALSISSRRDLSWRRLAVSSVFMGAGICGMHYTGMAAIQIVPAITYTRCWLPPPSSSPSPLPSWRCGSSSGCAAASRAS